MKRSTTMAALILTGQALLTGALTPVSAQQVQTVSIQQEQLATAAEPRGVDVRIERDTLTIRGTVASVAEKRKIEREFRAFWRDGVIQNQLTVRVE